MQLFRLGVEDATLALYCPTNVMKLKIRRRERKKGSKQQNQRDTRLKYLQGRTSHMKEDQTKRDKLSKYRSREKGDRP